MGSSRDRVRDRGQRGPRGCLYYVGPASVRSSLHPSSSLYINVCEDGPRMSFESHPRAPWD